MKLFNSLTNDLAEVPAAADHVVTLYSCGPTVYDHAHIGNLRTFIMDDLLRRTLNATGYDLKSVMNITDIDDKTIKKSQTEYPHLEPMAALLKSTRHYEQIFLDDLAAVGVDTDLFKIVRATESIPEMQKMIRDINDHGFAYISDGSVYFDLKKYRAAGNVYGRLVNVDFAAQARIDNDEYDKAEAQDFVLWKGEKSGEPAWDFELDGARLPGRPGWHIECSAMAVTNLGRPVTIHSGGIDLKFPHHENEIAQTVAATGADFCQIFTHHGHLFVDGRKMSKSLGNFYTLEDIRARDFHPLAFRMLALQASHGGELNFTWESLEAAQNRLVNYYAWADLIHQPADTTKIAPEAKGNLLIDILAGDLATPALLELIDRVIDNHIPSQEALELLDSFLGLNLANRPDITPEQKQLIADRQAARAAKDWAKSDSIRDQLASQNIALNDTPAGSIWYRTQI